MDPTGRRRNETIELTPDHYVCRFGGVTLAAPVVGGTVQFLVNERPWAVVVADLSGLGRIDVDLSTEVRVNELLDTCERRVFTGAVKSVDYVGPTVHIRLEMGQELVGVGSSLIAHRNCEIELIRSMTATAGVPYEPWGHNEPLVNENEAAFEVICPVAGISVSSPARFEGVLFEPSAPTVDRINSILEVPQKFQEWLRDFPAVARVEVSALYMHDAQEAGVRRIDETLGRLVTISRYSLLTSPDGTRWEWSREHKFFNPQRGQVAIVIGAATASAWIQRLDVPPYDHDLDLHSPPLLDFQGEQGELDPLSVREAMVFLARAARRIPVIDRVIFLWQSIEFFLGDYKTPKLFDSPAKKQVRAARNSLSDSLSSEQLARLDEVLGTINSPSMRMKLDHYIRTADVPVSASDYQLLWDLRAYRNGVIHGRSTSAPNQETVDRGIAVTARLFLWPRRTD